MSHIPAPGRWVETLEVLFRLSTNPSLPANVPFFHWGHLLHEDLARERTEGGAANDFSQHLEDLEIGNVVERRYGLQGRG